MNAMPVPLKGLDGHTSIFRLDLPNIQIASEELLHEIQKNNNDLYGLPLKDKFKDIESKKNIEQPIKIQPRNLVPKFDEAPGQMQNNDSNAKLLGKRDQPEEKQEPKIVFDQTGIEQQAEVSKVEA